MRPSAAQSVAHQLHALFEDALIVGEIDLERQVLARVVAAAGSEIDAPVREQVERRPLLGDADRMMQRQHRDGRREPDVFGARRDIGEHQIGAGEHAERVEVMLADPGRVHAELVGIERLVGNVGDELVGVARVVFVVVIAEREIAEVHALLPCWPSSLPCRHSRVSWNALSVDGTIVDIATVVNAPVFRCEFVAAHSGRRLRLSL